MLTSPETSASPTAPVVSKLTVTPAGITTFATLPRSGTAPFDQLAGSNQFPVAPPVHVTLSSLATSAIFESLVGDIKL